MALFWFSKKKILRDYAEFDVICYKQINESKLSHFVGKGESTDCYFFFFNHCLFHCVYITCQVQNMSSPESRTLCACWQFSYIKSKIQFHLIILFLRLRVKLFLPKRHLFLEVAFAFNRIEHTQMFSLFFLSFLPSSVSLPDNDIFCHSKVPLVLKKINLKDLEEVKKCGLNFNSRSKWKDDPWAKSLAESSRCWHINPWWRSHGDNVGFYKQTFVHR